MALVVYSCDTCNRRIERQQNKKGLDFFGRCVITDGCKGELRFESIKTAHNIPSIPPSVSGLVDWVKRSAMYAHNQQISSDIWRVVHNLGSEPSTRVFINDDDNEHNLTEVTPQQINILGPNSIEIVLGGQATGVVQCVSRSSNTNQRVKSLKPSKSEVRHSIPTIDISSFGRITIAIKGGNDQPINGKIWYISPSTNQQTYFPVSFDVNIPHETPWSGTSQVLMNGALYTVMCSNFLSQLTELETGTSVFFTMDTPVDTEAFSKSVVLLSSSPHSDVDRNFTQYATIFPITAYDAAISLQIRNGIIRGVDSLITQTYPPIRITR